MSNQQEPFDQPQTEFPEQPPRGKSQTAGNGGKVSDRKRTKQVSTRIGNLFADLDRGMLPPMPTPSLLGEELAVAPTLAYPAVEPRLTQPPAPEVEPELAEPEPREEHPKEPTRMQEEAEKPDIRVEPAEPQAPFVVVETVQPVEPRPLFEGKPLGIQVVSTQPTKDREDGEQILPAASVLTPSGWKSLTKGKPVIQPGQTDQPAVLAYARPLVTQVPTPKVPTALLLEILDDDPQRIWSPDELLLVEQVTDQLSLALENARLFNEARTSAEQLAVLNEMTRTLSSQLDVEEVLQTIHRYSSRLIDATHFSISLFYPERDEFSLPLIVRGTEQLKRDRQPLGNGLNEYIFHTRQPVLIKEHASEVIQRDLGLEPPPETHEEVVSWLGVPMLYSDQVIGAITVHSHTPSSLYDESHRDLLAAIANQAAVALVNARLFEQTQTALKALETSERYQKGVAQAVALLTERGITALSEVLRILGEAAQADRAYYIETQVDQRGNYWRLIAEWCMPGASSHLSNPALRRLSHDHLSNWIERLRSKGYATESEASATAQDKELLETFGSRSTLYFAVQGRFEVPGCIGFDRIEEEKPWNPDEIAALQTAASALATTFAREDLFTQLQINLAETEALYQASARLNSSATYEEILTVLRQHTILGHVNASRLLLNLFDVPWSQTDKPKWLLPIARWSAESNPEQQTQERYSLEEWVTHPMLLLPDRPTAIMDANLDPRLDEAARALYADRLGAKSLLFVPLNVAGSWIGHIIAIYRQTTGFPEQETRRLMSLAGQAAVAVQNLQSIQLATQRAQEAQQRSEELTTLNQITTAASRTLDLNEMLSDILARVLQVINYSAGLVSVVDPATNRLRLIVHQNLPEALVQRLVTQGMERTACELVYQLGRLVNVGDLKEIPEEISTWKGVFEGPLSLGLQAYLGVPLESKGKVLGTLCAFNNAPYHLEPVRISLMQAIGQQVGVVVENARLFQETQSVLAETEMLYEASAELNAVQSFDDVLKTLQKYTLIGKADNLVSFNLFDQVWMGEEPPEWAIPIAHWTTLPPEKLRWRYNLRNYPAIRLLTRDEPLIVEDIANDPRLDEGARQLYLDNFQARSTILVPMVVGGLWIGFINAVFSQPFHFVEAEVRRLLTLTGQASVAIQNLRNIQLAEQRTKEALRRSEELSSINRIVSNVAASLDLQNSLDIVTRELAEALRAHTGAALLNEERRVLTMVSSFSPFPDVPSTLGLEIPTEGNQFSQQVIEARNSLMVEDPQNDPITAPIHDILRKLDARTLLMIPLVAANQVIGAMSIEIIGEQRKFTPDEIRLAETIVLQASTAIQNARLFEQTQTVLAETEALYLAGAEFQVAKTYSEILEALRKYTVLSKESLSVTIDLYDRPWTEEMTPEWITSIARWGSLPLELASERYQLSAFPSTKKLLHPNIVTVIEDMRKDPRVDENMRALYTGLYRVQSVIFAPLVAGGQWIGHISALYSNPTQVTDEEIRRLTALTGQAAVAIQNLRLLEESRRRANQLQTAAEIARDTSSTLALDTLLSRCTNLLRDRFGYYHAAIFLTDEENEFAVIREATGEAGEEMKRQGFKLAIGSRSVVGQVTMTGHPIILNDITQDQAKTIHRYNPLLPLTRAELGIPLKIGDRVIGALDVQATRTNTFSQDDVSVLQVLADQIAVAVDNARAYELTQKAMEDIREAERLKSQFLANMSHELRTPLNSIIGFSRVILKGIDGPITEQQQQDLTAIYNSGQHLLGLINDVLDLSKIEAGKMELQMEENVNLIEIIKSVMSTTTGLVKDKPIALHQKLDPNLPTLRADPMKIRQVLLNLLSNAAKFTEKGSITVEAGLQTGPEGDSEVIVRVIDTGPGIAPEDQIRLFQPFSQVDGSLTRKSGGSGLGLSICHHLIRMHGGRIGLESQVGKGSTFYFTLPVGKREPVIPEPIFSQPELPDVERVFGIRRGTGQLAVPLVVREEAKQEKPPIQPRIAPLPLTEEILATLEPETSEEDRSTAAVQQPPEPSIPVTPETPPPFTTTILAIDKDPQVIETYKRYLSSREYTVIALTDLDQALDVAHNAQPTIITLDVAMQSPSGKDGWQVLKDLKSDPETSRIPVLVCTILPEQEKGFRLGAAGYLMKPILEEDLVRAVRHLQYKR